MITRSKAKALTQDNNKKEYPTQNISDIEEEINNIAIQDNNNITERKKSTIKTKPTDMKKVLKNLSIKETFTEAPKKEKFDRVKDNTFPMKGYNYMSDLLELPLTKEGYKYLLVVVDLWSNDFDIEPMESKSASDCLSAFKEIIKRQYTKLPKASIRTDGGTEFKGSFKAFLNENNILHRVAHPYRHKQLSNVESLNNLLGRIFMTYLTNKEQELKKKYTEWTDILPQVRKELNNARNSPKDINIFNTDPIPYNTNIPKFKIGDIVHKKLEVPKNIYGNIEANTKWRKGDLRFDPDEKLKIVNVLNYPNNNRYLLHMYPNVSFTENELKLVSKDDNNNNDEFYIVKEIIGKKKIKGKTYYLVHWKRSLKKDSTWELESNLLEDGLKDYIDEYNKKEK